MRFDNVRVPIANLLGKEGEGFTMMQSGIGVGRIALAMGSIGAAERGLFEMCRWGDVYMSSPARSSPIGRCSLTPVSARSRMEIEQCRAYVMRTAWLIEKYGMKASRSEVAQCKVLAPAMALAVLDEQFSSSAAWAFHTIVRLPRCMRTSGPSGSGRAPTKCIATSWRGWSLHGSASRVRPPRTEVTRFLGADV